MKLEIILLLFAVIHAAGGIHSAVHKLQQIDPQLVSPKGVDNILSPTFLASFSVLVCFGVIGLPHTAVCCISYKDSKAVHQGIVLGLCWEKVNVTGALSSMIIGAGCCTLLATLSLQPWDFHPIVPSLLLSLIAFAIGNCFGHDAAPTAQA